MIYPGNRNRVPSASLNAHLLMEAVAFNFAEQGVVQAQRSGADSAVVAGCILATCECCVGSEDRWLCVFLPQTPVS